jgi:hypothetical protein
MALDPHAEDGHGSAHWETIAHWRDQRARAEPDAFLRNCKLFFNALDLANTVEARTLWPAGRGRDLDLRAAALERLPELLMGGLRARAAGQSFPYRESRDSSELQAWTREIVGTFRSALWESGLPAKDLPEAFDLFARSALMLARPEDRTHPLYHVRLLPACQPNSAYLFLLAEFADLCDTLGVDGEFWAPLLPTAVYVQGVLHESVRRRLGVGPLRWDQACASEPPAPVFDRATVGRERGAFLASQDLHVVWRFNVRRRVEPPPR